MAVEMAIALSVMLHATWNIIARNVRFEANFIWWGLGVHIILFSFWTIKPLLIAIALKPQIAIMLLITTIFLSIYFFSLYKAYSFGAVTFVFPIARSSPILIAIWSFLFLSEHTRIIEWVGIFLSIIGLVWLGWVAGEARSLRAIIWALIASISTSFYSLADKIAVMNISTSSALMGYVTVAFIGAFLTLSIYNYISGGDWKPKLSPHPLTILIGSISIGMSYFLLIYAMQYMPPAHVVAYSNASTILVVLVSIFIFKERSDWGKKLSSVAIICLGLITMSI